MTYFEVERYVSFYSDRESEKTIELVKAFCIYNAESTYIGQSATMSKHGGNNLTKYANDIKIRFSGKEEAEDFDVKHLEKQFGSF